MWYKIYLGFWVWELQKLAQHGALLLAIFLGLVGLCRRPFLAKLLSITSLMLAVNALWAININWLHPLAVAWSGLTYWSFDMPIGYLQSKARPNYINLGTVYLIYAVMLWLLARPFYRRLNTKLTRAFTETARRMGWQPSNLL